MSFCCLIVSARNSNTLLNTYGESEHPCLYPDFSGVSSNVSPFNLRLYVGLLCIAFIIFRYLISILFKRRGVIYCQVVASVKEDAANP